MVGGDTEVRGDGSSEGHSAGGGDGRGDGDRGQTKGLTRAVGQRGGAQAEAGNDEEFKGGKRLQGWKGRTAKGKRPKGDGSSDRAEGITGTGVAGGGDGANSGQKKIKRKEKRL